MVSAKSKKQIIEIFAGKGKKTKAPLKCPFRCTKELWRVAFEILSRQKIWEIEEKNNRRKLSPSSWKKQWIPSKNKHKENLAHISFPPTVPIDDLRNTYPWVNSLFSARIAPNNPLAGRSKHFLEAREILTKDPESLGIVKGFKIPFVKNPTQEKVRYTPHMGQEQATLIQVETDNMLKKGAIQQTGIMLGSL